jgi:hypothetical protein
VHVFLKKARWHKFIVRVIKQKTLITNRAQTQKRNEEVHVFVHGWDEIYDCCDFFLFLYMCADINMKKGGDGLRSEENGRMRREEETPKWERNRNIGARPERALTLRAP